MCDIEKRGIHVFQKQIWPDANKRSPHKERHLKRLPKHPIPSSPINTIALTICICFESKPTVRLRTGQRNKDSNSF